MPRISFENKIRKVAAMRFKWKEKLSSSFHVASRALLLVMCKILIRCGIKLFVNNPFCIYLFAMARRVIPISKTLVTIFSIHYVGILCIRPKIRTYGMAKNKTKIFLYYLLHFSILREERKVSHTNRLVLGFLSRTFLASSTKFPRDDLSNW